MTFLGIDIGTSAVKAVLVGEKDEAVLAAASVPLSTSQPRPGWSEQAPEDWWNATRAVVGELRRAEPTAFARVASIGLSGQMHGAVILDAGDWPIRPAILWNDGRAVAECAEIAREVPEVGRIAGIIAMPGFTAPKLRWLKTNEPTPFRRTTRFVLAKDYVRLKLTGEAATDMADAAGTLLLDEARRDWSDALLAAAGVERSMAPRLLEGSASSGTLRPGIAAAWGLSPSVIVAAGAADAAAGAIGIGAIEEGDSFLSLGTSSQFFVTRDRYEPKPETLIHAYAHALPGRWFEMAAMLNGANVLGWAAHFLGAEDIGALLDRVERNFKGPSRVIFLPYLTGERTPHNDPLARSAFAGLDSDTSREDLIQAVLEGVAFSLMDAALALGSAGRKVDFVSAVGGGARSRFWLKLIASALRLPVRIHEGADKGPAFGAARLARLALTAEAPAEVCRKPAVLAEIVPDEALSEGYAARFETFRALYRATRRVRSAARDSAP